MRNAVRRRLVLRNLRCGAHPAGRARLPAFHRGSSPGTHASQGATSDQVSRSGYRDGGVSRRCRPGYSDAPRMPVIMPADMMSETAREWLARPSAGAVLARRSGLPPDRLLHEGEDYLAITNKDNVKHKVSEMTIYLRMPARLHIGLWPNNNSAPEFGVCALWVAGSAVRADGEVR